MPLIPTITDIRHDPGRGVALRGTTYRRLDTMVTRTGVILARVQEGGIVAVSSLEPTIAAEVSESRLLDTTAGIARWVRLSGTPDEMRAVEYVRDLLDGYGLQTDLILHDAYISLPGPASIETAGGDTVACITHSFSAATPPEGVTGEIVDAAAPGETDVRGRIALMDGLAGPEVVRQAEARGAIAQIYVNGPLTHEMIVSPVWGSPDRQTLDYLPHTPVVSVDEETGARLRELLARGQAKVRIQAEVDTGWRQTPILIANLPGPSDDFVLFSGHIDSWHYGAMDNGSANATMIEVARLMAEHRQDLRRGLRLAFWSGHSHGRYSGSAWYADNHWLDLDRHCVAHINVDSVGGLGATVLTEGIAMASTRGLGGDVIHGLTGETFRGSRVGRSGDQSFVGLGIPSLWMSLSAQPPSNHATSAAFGLLVGESRSGGLGWWWHTTQDTIDKIDPALLVRDARIYAVAVTRLLTAKLLPFNAAPEVRELLDHLRSWQETCPSFDLAPAIQQAERLLSAAESLDAWGNEHADRATDEQARRFNHTLSAVLRAVISVDYTAAGPFGHDPALTMPPVPALAALDELARLPATSDEARFLRVELVRARNRIVHALLEATERLDAWDMAGAHD